jgi:hypothetical protein
MELFLGGEGKGKGRGRKVFTPKISSLGFHYFDVLNFRMQ